MGSGHGYTDNRAQQSAIPQAAHQLQLVQHEAQPHHAISQHQDHQDRAQRATQPHLITAVISYYDWHVRIKLLFFA